MNLHTFYLPLVPITCLATAGLAFFLLLNLPQRIRNVCFPVFIVPAWRAFATSEHFTWPATLEGIWSLAVLIWMAHIISCLYIEKVPPKSKDRQQWDIRAAYKLLFDVRHLQQPEISSSSYSLIINPDTSKRLFAFIARQVLKLLLYWFLTTCLFTPLIPLIFGPVEPWEFDHIAQTFFRRLYFFSPTEPVTLRETFIRVFFTLRWIWLSFVDVDAAHTLLSIVFVGVLRLDEPEEWPAMFGNPSNAFTLRGYWGRFWHRLVRKPYLSFATVVSEKLRIRSLGASAEKLFLAFMVFLISGLAHAVVSLHKGNVAGAIDDVAFYWINFFAIAAEGLILNATRPISRLLPLWCWKIVGFAWVFVFWFWAAPKWSYPEVHEELIREIQSRKRSEGLEKMASLLSGK